MEKKLLKSPTLLTLFGKQIPKAIAEAGSGKMESANLATHHVKIKTKGAFLILRYQKMEISLTAVDEKTTKMSITAETPW